MLASYYQKLRKDKDGNLVAPPNARALGGFWFFFIVGCCWLLLTIVIVRDIVLSAGYHDLIFSISLGISILFVSLLFRRKYTITPTDLILQVGFQKRTIPLAEVKAALRLNLPEINKRMNVPLFLNGNRRTLRLGWVIGGAELMRNLEENSGSGLANIKAQTKSCSALKDDAIVKIRIAQVAGICSIIFIAFMFLLLMGMAKVMGAKETLHFIPTTVVFNCLIVLGLVFGLHRKNRIAAILLLLHLVFVTVWCLLLGKTQIMGVFFILGAAYVVGIKGTFDYRKLEKMKQRMHN